MQQQAPAPHALGIPKAADALDVSRAHVRRLIARGELRGVQLGRRVVVPMAEIERLLAPQHGGSTK
jgi:excisionase family DNA binding protein